MISSLGFFFFVVVGRVEVAAGTAAAAGCCGASAMEREEAREGVRAFGKKEEMEALCPRWAGQGRIRARVPLVRVLSMSIQTRPKFKSEIY